MRSAKISYQARGNPPEFSFFPGLSQVAALALLVFFSLALSSGAGAATYSNALAGSSASSLVRQSEQARQAAPAGAARAQGKPTQQAAPDAKANFPDNFPKDAQWRVRLLETAVVRGPAVLLGEIAAPAGPMPPELWEQLKDRELWPAPEEEGRQANLTRPKLQQAILGSLGKGFAQLCLYPPALTIQRGGKLYDGASVQELTLRTLAPYLANLPGESSLSDFRLPANIFLSSASQKLELEAPLKVVPGRLSLCFAIREVDGSVPRRITGNVFVDCWAPVPCVTAPLNKGEVLAPELITYKRKNLAYLRNEPWDGRGGPWQALRPIGLEQPILRGDLAYVPTVKKGQVIKLVFESGSVRLVAAVEAMSDGVSGETIPVKNLQSKRQVYAVVYDKNRALASPGALRGLQAASGQAAPGRNSAVD